MAGVTYPSVRFRALTHGLIALRTAPQIAAYRAFILAHLERIQSEVQPYPPVPPPPNRYKRTNALYNSWHIRAGSEVPAPTGLDMTLVVGSSLARYARFVHGTATYQRPYHQAHGWKRLTDYTHQDDYKAGIAAINRTFRIQ